MAAVFAIGFAKLPIENTTLALDWRGIFQAIQGGRITYDVSQHLPPYPPWSLIPLLPLGWLPFQASWGLMTFLTLAVLLLSVPPAPRPLWVASVLWVSLSFPALRHFADGNLEGEVVAGVLLLLAGYRSRNPMLWIGGLLLATTKVQVVWLLLLVVAVGVVRQWPMRRWLIPTLAALLLAGLSLLWFGRDWFRIVGDVRFWDTVVNMSLTGTMGRLQVSPLWILLTRLVLAGLTLWIGFRDGPEVSRVKAGFLILASLLISPYSAANSFLTVLAIGVVPLFQVRPGIGLLLLVLINVPLLAPWFGRPTWLYSEYWTGISLITWLVMALTLRSGLPSRSRIES